MGHMISSDGINIDSDTGEAVRSWHVPNDKRQLRSFLGLYTYYRRVVRVVSYKYNVTFCLVRSVSNSIRHFELGFVCRLSRK